MPGKRVVREEVIPPLSMRKASLSTLLVLAVIPKRLPGTFTVKVNNETVCTYWVQVSWHISESAGFRT